MSLTVVGRQQMNPVTGLGFKMPGSASEQGVVKQHSSTHATQDDSATHASQHSGATKQQLASSITGGDAQQKLSASQAAAPSAGPAAAGTQPASPESVNAGQKPAAAMQAAAGHTSSGEHSKAAAQQQQPPLQQQQQQGGNSAAPAQQQLDKAAAVQHSRQQQQNAVEAEALLEPLSAPEESEDAEMHDEYEIYMQRWQAGTTLRQRWHRLQAKGLLAGIQAEWEDWQHDLLLDTIQQQLLTHSTLGASIAAPTTRARRGRNELEGSCLAASLSAGGAAAQEPRRVRTRRAPALYQDFHVETPATGSPDRHDSHAPAPTAAELQRRGGLLALGQHHQQQQQRQQQQQLQQQYSGLGAAAAGGWEGPPARDTSRQQQLQPPPLPRQSLLSRQQQQPPPQQQQQPGAAPQQHQAAGNGEVLSEEFIRKFRATIEMVISSGNAQGMEGAAALLIDPEGLKAFVNVLRQHTSNPAATLHKLAATLAGQHV